MTELEEAVNAAILAVVDTCKRTGQPPSDVVGEPELESLSQDVFQEIARVGYVGLVNDWLHRERCAVGGGSVQASPPMHPSMGRNPRDWHPLDRTLVGADNRLKPLWKFDAHDAVALRQQAEAQRAAFARRKRWTELALAMLSEHEVTRIENLPPDEIDRLGREADLAWA